MSMEREIKRGDIFYVTIPYATGHEIEKDRPAIVVSCEELNRTSPCVTVVMCSASPKKELPEHITIRTTPVVSTALCEHIYTVDKSRLGKFVGRCTKAEIAALDIGIMSALALGAYDLARPVEAAAEAHPVEQPFPLVQPDMELAIAQMERDVYKSMYESLLDRITMERRAGA